MTIARPLRRVAHPKPRASETQKTVYEQRVHTCNWVPAASSVERRRAANLKERWSFRDPMESPAQQHEPIQRSLLETDHDVAAVPRTAQHEPVGAGTFAFVSMFRKPLGYFARRAIAPKEGSA